MTIEKTGKHYSNTGKADGRDFVLDEAHSEVQLVIKAADNNFSVDKLKELILVLHYMIDNQNP